MASSTIAEPVTGGYRQRLIRGFTFLGGIYFFLEFVLPPRIGGIEIAAYHSQISDGFVLIGTMAIGLGIINLLMVHGARIVFRRSGALNSVALLAGLVIMLAMSWFDWRAGLGISRDVGRALVLRDFAIRIQSDVTAATPGVPPLEVRLAALWRSADEVAAQFEAPLTPLANMAPGQAERLDRALVDQAREVANLRASVATLRHLDSATALTRLTELSPSLAALAGARRDVLSIRYSESATKFAYALLYDGLFVGLGSAMFSLLGFYIASAAYRAFRIRSAESALMMVAAVIVMLGQIPFGLWIWSDLPELRLWLLSTPSSAAFRAIKFGATVAGLILAFRIWCSIESESFGRRRR